MIKFKPKTPPTASTGHTPADATRRSALVGSVSAVAGALAAGTAGAQVQVVNASAATALGNITQAFAVPSDISPMTLMAEVCEFTDQALKFGQGGTPNPVLFAQKWAQARKMDEAARALISMTNPMIRGRLELVPGQFVDYEVEWNIPVPSAEDFVAAEARAFYMAGVPHLAIAANRRAPADRGRVVLAKILSGLGAIDHMSALSELLEAEGWFDPRNWGPGKTPRTLELLLKRLAKPDFIKKLANKIGLKNAQRLLGRISGRLIPGIGWALFIASLLWAFYEQTMDPPQPPRPPQPQPQPRHPVPNPGLV